MERQSEGCKIHKIRSSLTREDGGAVGRGGPDVEDDPALVVGRVAAPPVLQLLPDGHVHLLVPQLLGGAGDAEAGGGGLLVEVRLEGHL